MRAPRSYDTPSVGLMHCMQLSRSLARWIDVDSHFPWFPTAVPNPNSNPKPTEGSSSMKGALRSLFLNWMAICMIWASSFGWPLNSVTSRSEGSGPTSWIGERGRGGRRVEVLRGWVEVGVGPHVHTRLNVTETAGLQLRTASSSNPSAHPSQPNPRPAGSTSSLSPSRSGRVRSGGSGA